MEQPPRVPLAKFSAAIQKALLQRNVGRDGYVYPSDMIEPLTCMQDSSLPLKVFSSKLRPRLAALGPQVNAEILTKACEALTKKRALEASRKAYLGATAIFAGVVAIVSMAALLWLVVALRRQAQNVHGVLVDRATGLPLRTANTDFAVGADGTLVNRETSRSLATASRRDELKLSSSADPRRFTSVQSLVMGGVNAKVHGYAVLPAREVVLFFTSHGRAVLNGSTLYPTLGPYEVFETLDTDTILAEAFAAGAERRGDTLNYDPLTGMDASGLCILCTVCSCWDP